MDNREKNRLKVLNYVKEGRDMQTFDCWRCIVVKKDAFGYYERHVGLFELRGDAEMWMAEITHNATIPYYGTLDGVPMWNDLDALLEDSNEI